MRTAVWSVVFLFTLGMNAVATVGQAQNQPQPMPKSGMGQMDMDHGMKKLPPAGPLKLSYMDKSAEWTPATLAALPHTTLTVYNSHAKTSQTFSGVLLIDLLTRLGVPDKPHGKDFKLYLVAEGSDGYQVVYSAAEITPDVHDGTVLVADSLDGEPLADSGSLQLVATGEKRPARWVRSLVAIRVETAQ